VQCKARYQVPISKNQTTPWSKQTLRRQACKIASLHYPGTNDDEQFSSFTDMNTVRILAPYTRYQNKYYKDFSIKRNYTIIFYTNMTGFVEL
jgi:hypothetical protein